MKIKHICSGGNLIQGSHFLENQGMSGDFVLTGMSGNFAACRGREFFCEQMPIFGLLSDLSTDIGNVNNGISGEIVFTASVVLDAVGNRIIMTICLLALEVH